MYVYKSTVESGVANAAFRAILLAAQSHAVPAEGKAPVSACVPTFTRESERGPFVRETEKCDEKRFGTAL